MQKVPVGRSIARAYALLGGGILDVIGLSWLPAAFLGGAVYWWLVRVTGGLEILGKTASTGERLSLVGDTALFVAAALLLISAMSAPLARAAGGEGHERVFANLRIGVGELRLFVSLLVVAVLVGVVLDGLVLLFALGLDTALVRVLAPLLPGAKSYSLDQGELWRGLPLRALVGALAIGAISLVLAFILARFALLLPALVARGEHSLLSKSLRASRRNSWRLFVVLSALALPVAAASVAAIVAVLGKAHAPALLAIGAHAAPLAAVATVAVVVLVALAAGAGSCALEALASNLAQEPAHVHEEQEQRMPVMEPALALASVHPLATMLPEPAEKTEPTTEVPVTPLPEPAVIEPAAIEPAAAAEAPPAADLLAGGPVTLANGKAEPEHTEPQHAAAAEDHGPANGAASPPAEASTDEPLPALSVADQVVTAVNGK